MDLLINFFDKYRGMFKNFKLSEIMNLKNFLKALWTKVMFLRNLIKKLWISKDFLHFKKFVCPPDQKSYIKKNYFLYIFKFPQHLVKKIEYFKELFWKANHRVFIRIFFTRNQKLVELKNKIKILSLKKKKSFKL